LAVTLFRTPLSGLSYNLHIEKVLKFRIGRWLFLLFGIVATWFGLALTFVVPGPFHPAWKDRLFDATPFFASVLLLTIAAWLRTREASYHSDTKTILPELLTAFAAYAIAAIVVGFLVIVASFIIGSYLAYK
jgi:hypothetical protein